jgi:hypothetical protein
VPVDASRFCIHRIFPPDLCRAGDFAGDEKSTPSYKPLDNLATGDSQIELAIVLEPIFHILSTSYIRRRLSKNVKVS